ncbi:carbohydrate ABC transporter permease [Bacillus sp. AFS041924]|uniref:carbohydrate ABC transporter permease n=1 Tax=Bacillus sp. AFS041924 TaxID=2033503 RepID=UPI000BFCE702|nr:sugar ABC transporter permease [Bacillus sp. AFS041924]PGS56046.1 ABC transporter permease [Bacillus sp. AFS041924]
MKKEIETVVDDATDFKVSSRKKRRNSGSFIVFVGPAFLVFAALVLVPFLMGLYYSFTNWNGVVGNIQYVGFDNYKYIFTQDADFKQSFIITTKYTFFAVILTNLIGFGLALLVTKGLKSRNILRTIFFLPNLIGGLLLGFIWQFIFNKGLTSLGAALGIDSLMQSLLGTAKGAFWAIIIVAIWQGAGYIMIIYVAALQGVPQELIEAAQVDGADRFTTLRKIIIPMVAPAVTVCLFLTISWSFKVFDQNLSLTGGGPFKSTEMLALNIYTEAFVNNRYGLGEAKAIVFFIVVAAISILQVYITKKREVEA